MNVPATRFPAAAAARRGQSAEPPERARILIVDDDERNLLALRRVLEDIADVLPDASREAYERHQRLQLLAV
jgi:response regulator RpfG family c-di-GMP phosphodiesterase